MRIIIKHFIAILMAALLIGNRYSQQNTFSKVLVNSKHAVHELTSLPTPKSGDYLWDKTFVGSQSSS